jgi:hypothetical protein
LYTLLRKFYGSGASDPRDNIYALLSVATDVEVMVFPKGDYNLSVREILNQTIAFMFPCQWTQNPPDCDTFSDLIRDLETLNNTTIVQAAEDGQDTLLRRMILNRPVGDPR